MWALRGQVFEDANGLTAAEWCERHTRPESNGPKVLCAAILREAWWSATQRIPPLPPGRLRKAIRQHARSLRAQQAEAVRWFSADDTFLFSFRHLCAALELDPARIRRTLAAAIDRRTPSFVARTEHQENRAGREAKDQGLKPQILRL